RLVGRVGVEDGELVAVVLEEEVVRRSGAELEPVGAGGGVRPPQGAVGGAVPGGAGAAGVVRRFRLGVLFVLPPAGGGHYHRWPRSIEVSGSGSAQKSADRYFQPASARMQTTTEPCSTSSASLRATCTTAPADTPAKMPSRSSRARRPATDSAFETSSFRSSLVTSRIGGTYPPSSERRPMTGSRGSGSAAATPPSGQRSRSRSPVPISVPPVPRPATSTSTCSSASTI